jgi:myosin heavy subunit
MKNIGFSELEIDHVMNITVAILLLGNVEFDSISKAGVGDISNI